MRSVYATRLGRGAGGGSAPGLRRLRAGSLAVPAQRLDGLARDHALRLESDAVGLRCRCGHDRPPGLVSGPPSSSGDMHRGFPERPCLERDLPDLAPDRRAPVDLAAGRVLGRFGVELPQPRLDFPMRDALACVQLRLGRGHLVLV